LKTTDGLPIGFIGIGIMGQPMARNLIKAGTRLVVWNRSADKAEALAAAGATVAQDIDDLFDRCEVVIFMMVNEAAMDAVVGRGTPAFANRVKGRTIVQMGTTSPTYSKALETDLRAAGGYYVEAPVSGSRKPAETGQLVAMLAGDEESIARVRPLLRPLCRETVVCGPVPSALSMKLAVNVFMLCMVTGLAESVHFADRNGLDLNQLATILNVSPMASDVSRVKISKLVSRDFTAQATITDALANNHLIVEAARAAGIASPLVDVCRQLYGETLTLGLGSNDVISVLRAIEARSDLSSAKDKPSENSISR